MIVAASPAEEILHKLRVKVCAICGTLEHQGVADTEEFALFGGGDAGVGGHTVEVVEPLAW